PAPPRSVKRGVPHGLAAVCAKAMARDQGDRYGTAGELAADVERWLADQPVSAAREPLAVRAGRWAKRNRALVTAAVGLLAAAVPLLAALAAVSERGRREVGRQLDLTRAAEERASREREAAEAMAGRRQKVSTFYETAVLAAP